MKSIIVMASVHHENTKKIVEAIELAAKCFRGEDEYVQVQNKQHRVVNRRSR